MKELKKIRCESSQRAEKEAYKLWRLARRAKEKNCSAKLVNEIREEAEWLYTTATTYPERITSWELEYRLKYAFRWGGVRTMKRLFVNRETGELLTREDMLKQYKEEYDGSDPTNIFQLEEYYEEYFEED